MQEDLDRRHGSYQPRDVVPIREAGEVEITGCDVKPTVGYGSNFVSRADIAPNWGGLGTPKTGETLGQTTGGMHKDAGKPRLELLDPYAMEQAAAVLAFGAVKYERAEPKSVNDVFQWAEMEVSKWFAENARKESPKSVLPVSVEVATKSGFARLTLNMQNASGRITETGQPGIKIGSAPMVQSAKVTHLTERETRQLTGSCTFANGDYASNLSKNCPTSKVGDAGFASATSMMPPVFTLTMTMHPASREGCCVADATTALECLGKLWRALKEQSPTSRPLPLMPFCVDGDRIVQRHEGAWNWTRGIAYTRLIGSALRHIFAFSRGEDLDPESGLPHLAHGICCLMMLLGTTKRHPELDDRCKTEAA